VMGVDISLPSLVDTKKESRSSPPSQRSNLTTVSVLFVSAYLVSPNTAVVRTDLDDLATDDARVRLHLDKFGRLGL